MILKKIFPSLIDRAVDLIDLHVEVMSITSLR